jgi:hypothetical protein
MHMNADKDTSYIFSQGYILPENLIEETRDEPAD